MLLGGIFKLSDNVLQLTEVGDYEAQNLKQPQMIIQNNTFQFTTKPSILVRCCYTLIYFLFFLKMGCGGFIL